MPPPVEISIPTTSTAPQTPSTKPYTLYNITLRLPLRSFVVQKRYSDFSALHTSLSSLIGTPPPAPLPAKSWFSSTISSPALTETRRAGLERYLRAVAESPDRRWRDTAAWRAFLNLPSTAASSHNSAKSASGVGAQVGDPGAWIDAHKEMRKALHDARMQLARRDAAIESRGTAGAVEAGAAAKRELVRVGGLLGGLGEGLRVLQEGGRVGEGELRRRRDLLSAARVERDGLEKLSASLASARGESSRGGGGVASASERTALVGSGPRAGGRVLGAPLPETERTRELDNVGVVQLQKQMMEDQDQDVEALAKIVRRQREMGLAIKEEVDLQTSMLDRMDQDVDRVEAKTKIAKDRIRRLG